MRQIERLASDCLEAHLADVKAEREASEDLDGRPYDGAHFVSIDSDDGSPEWLAEYNDEAWI